MIKISEAFDLNSDLMIDSIMQDSRKKSDRAIFFAYKGKLNDGHKFIDQAIANGAVCIVHSDEVEKKAGILYIKTSNVERAFSHFCRVFYDNPLHKMEVIGITGTNGKTTIAWTIRSIIAHFHQCGYIGTMGYSCADDIADSKLNLTTPKADELFRIAKQMRDGACSSVVLEASSEGLYTHRLDEVEFDCALFNNLSVDHMDVHGNMENYFACKCQLFNMLKKDGIAIINNDDQYGQRLEKLVKSKIVTFGIDSYSDYQAKDIRLEKDHSEFTLIYKNKEYPVTTKLLGKFNIYNLLGVIAVCNELNYPLSEVIELIASQKPTPGRGQAIDIGQDFNVLIDFAFTKNSFISMFDYARKITPKDKKIIALFGASGDRDHSRRPLTASIADEKADVVILSYDDPSSEDMMDILIDLKSYFSRLDPEIILDRYQAIKKAVSLAEKGDTLLILGKGSDRFFLDKKGRIPWMGDESAVIKAINELNIL